MIAERKDWTPAAGALTWTLVTFPLLGFAGEYYFSARDGMLAAMFSQPTVMYGDWLLMPFNFLAAQIVDWRRGARLFVVGMVAMALVIAAHAVWQAQRLGPFNFITAAGIVTTAGWIHLAYSCIETTLLLAFIFCGRESSLSTIAAGLAAIYILALGWGNYTIHHGFVALDLTIEISGLALILLYPRRKMAAGEARRQPLN